MHARTKKTHIIGLATTRETRVRVRVRAHACIIRYANSETLSGAQIPLENVSA